MAANPSISSLTSQLAAAGGSETASRRRIDCNTNRESTASTAATTRRPAPVPFTPRKLATKLQLQMPSRMQPLTPQLDPALGYSTAARISRPRTLDFARSCTSLHHSTLAQSAESSPMTPNTRHHSPRRALDSPIVMQNHNSASMSFDEGSVRGERSGDDSDSESSLELDDIDMDSLPPVSHHARRSTIDSSGSASLLKLRHAARLQGHRRSRQSSSSASVSNSSMASPSPTTPPPSDLKPSTTVREGYFAITPSKPLNDLLSARRDSLSQAMNDVMFEADLADQADLAHRPLDAIKRPVTRRGSLLPKTKHFQRVKAALLEESAPEDSEVKREAVITRQLREDDEAEEPFDMPVTPHTHYPGTETLQYVEDSNSIGRPELDKRRNVSFRTQAVRNANEGFWETMESSSPPQFFGMRMNLDGDIIMNSSESMANSPVATHFNSPEHKRHTPMPLTLKRRRTDDEVRFEQPAVFKRRAVSPGLGASPSYGNGFGFGQSSPIPIGRGSGTGGGKRSSFVLDTHEVLLKMSLGDGNSAGAAGGMNFGVGL